jgi:hypothetical protein
MAQKLLTTLGSGILLITATLTVMILGGDGYAAAVAVNSQANIFGAGEATPPGPGVGGAGVLPPSVAVPAGSNFVTFGVTGEVSCCDPPAFNGPDGGTVPFSTTDVSSLSGISGIKGPGSMFLVGVFTDGTNPTDPAPDVLDFGSIGTNFASLSPELNQSFFVGDGLTGTGGGTAQQFFVPEGATTLFLGFADALAFNGDPDFYGDNDGELTADVTFTSTQETPAGVPEPATIVMLGAGLLGLAAATRRRAGIAARR